ncbi:translation initiation factor IF-2-like [Corvus hawaiiensis]|uniref:translation initiation factor IF-2-like n=1 Tax=Corvus hawaiiensis TaxID=134902 RepID=UPI0020198FED|nr:translation initiation factor IF-2-like [Corvus hawaiiensis]
MAQRDAAKECPPGKAQEADAESSSSLSAQPRPSQARRRPWSQRAQNSGSRTGKPIRLNRVPLLRAEISSPSAASRAPRRPWSQRAQNSGSRTGKPIRLNRVPLLRAETSSPSAASQALSGLAQGTGPVNSSSGSSGSLPRQQQGAKPGCPQGATEPQAPEGPPAKRRRIGDVPAPSAETSSPGTATQVVSGLPQSAVLVSGSSSFPRRQKGTKRRYPQGATEPQAPEGPPAKRRRIGDVPAPSAETSSPGTATQVSGLPQSAVLVSGSSSFPRRRQKGTKRRYPQGATEPQAPESPRARRQSAAGSAMCQPRALRPAALAPPVKRRRGCPRVLRQPGDKQLHTEHRGSSPVCDQPLPAQAPSCETRLAARAAGKKALQSA